MEGGGGGMREEEDESSSSLRSWPKAVHNGALEPTPYPKYRGWDDPVPAPAVPGIRPCIFGGRPIALHRTQGPPLSLSPSLVSLSVSLRSRRLLPALLLKFRPSKVNIPCVCKKKAKATGMVIVKAACLHVTMMQSGNAFCV